VAIGEDFGACCRSVRRHEQRREFPSIERLIPKQQRRQHIKPNERPLHEAGETDCSTRRSIATMDKDASPQTAYRKRTSFETTHIADRADPACGGACQSKHAEPRCARSAVPPTPSPPTTSCPCPSAAKWWPFRGRARPLQAQQQRRHGRSGSLPEALRTTHRPSGGHPNLQGRSYPRVRSHRSYTPGLRTRLGRACRCEPSAGRQAARRDVDRPGPHQQGGAGSAVYFRGNVSLVG
jgi:hypothetical protein